jgi:hypothetical protein
MMIAMSTLQVVTIAIPGAIGLAALAWAVISWRRTGSKIEAKLAVGQIDYSDGFLSVEFASGESSIMTVSNPHGEKISTRPTKPSKGRKKLRNRLIKESRYSFKPVNVIFAHNKGRTAVTLSRCEYIGDLAGKIGFQFEPQPAVSPFGDHLPKRLDPGQDAILIHDYKIMKAFLNEVMHDQDVEAATFTAVLTLGDGRQVAVSPGFLIHAAAGPEVTDVEYEVWCQESPMPHFTLTRRWPFLGRR